MRASETRHRGVRGGTRDALRAATKPCHARLERRFSPEIIMRSRSAYRGALVALLGFYEPLEAALCRVPAPIDLRERAKAPALRADLVALGLSQAEIASASRCRDLPELEGMAEALGVAYVLEGATLGARIIAGRARDKLGVSPEPGGGGQFFGAYGRDTGSRWRAFLATLEDAIAPGERPRAARAARETFESLERWLAARGALA